MPGTDPLILTARLDAASAGVFQRLRDRHFPARLNIVPAHLTLFHQLAGDARPAIEAALVARCADQAPIPFAARGFRFLGRGVAVAIEAEGLVATQRHFAGLWTAGLTPQDRQPFRPHVTIQNKAEPAAARALLARLEAEGLDVRGDIVGLDLWHYRGGPWEMAGHAAFGISTAGPDGEHHGAPPRREASATTAKGKTSDSGASSRGTAP